MNNKSIGVFCVAAFFLTAISTLSIYFSTDRFFQIIKTSLFDARLSNNTHYLVAFFLAFVLLSGAAGPGAAQSLSFQHIIIDAANPARPTTKTLGDIDGDGFIDGVVGSSNGGGMFWYEYPDWTKHTIRAAGSWTTDMQAGDVDGDGDLDIVLPNSGGIKWYENPGPIGDPRIDNWVEHLIGSAGADAHDVEIGDVDGDGDMDVVTREGSTIFWRQESPDTWTAITVTTRAGAGTSLGDLDGDGDVDIAQNGYWVEQVSPTTWVTHDIDPGVASEVGVLITDINGDGFNDVVMAPAESANLPFSWYEAFDPVNGPWTEHIIDPTTSYFHTFEAADMDQDGDLDLVTAEMHQSTDPDEVSVYLNNGQGLSWTQLIVATSGSHNIRVGDIGNDGDLDIFGANWDDSAPNSAVVEMWENLSSGAILPLDWWQRHIIETSLPWKPYQVEGKDLDGDSLPDLVTGGWWYSNSGSLGGPWTRTTIGSPLNNMATVHDFDTDGDLDVLGTNGGNLWWAENDGTGNFTVLDTAAGTEGDFLQGVSVDQIIPGGKEEVVLSWHNALPGTNLLEVPSDPTLSAWPLSTLSLTTNGEEVPTGDIDGDGLVDVHLGNAWLRQLADGSFDEQPGLAMSSGVPDRVSLADIDGDGDLDVVIGAEGANLLIWGENQNNGAVWSEHVIATAANYLSVDVGDIDGDGDIDVVAGAHLANGEVFIYENAGEGLSWFSHVVDPGDSTLIDHHDGTQLVDMDLDGDLDIISIGFGTPSLVVYENLAIDGVTGNRPPVASAATVTTDQDVPVAITLQASDADGDPLSYSVPTPPVSGTLTGTAPNLTYAPNAGFSGSDSFVFQVTDGNGGTDSAMISIIVNPITPVNQPPVATDATVATTEGVPVDIVLQASDPDGDTLSYSVTIQPTNGALSGIAPNLTYTPNTGFSGADNFVFQVDDGNGGTDTATISIAVGNQLPVATAATVVTDESVAVAITLQASDPDGDTLSYSVISGPTNGTLTGTAPDLTYTPNAGFTGADSFDFQVDDGNGGTDTAAVSITVIPVAAGLVAYWPMSEGSGTTTADASGNGHNGTLVSDASWSAGIPGVTFGGVNGRVNVGNFDVAGSAITLAALVRSDNLGNCPGYNDCRIISKATGQQGQDHYFMLSTFSTNGGATTSLRFRLKTGGITTTLIANAGTIANNQWVHAAAVYDGTTMRLYLNGVQVGSTAKSGALTTNPGVSVWIGDNPTNTGAGSIQAWDGQIDEVRVYDRALSIQEIQDLALVNQPGA